MAESERGPRVRARVEKALQNKHSAAGMRVNAEIVAPGDPTGAKFLRADANTLDTKADEELSRWSYTTGQAVSGNGGELVPLPEAETSNIGGFVRDRADMLAHTASTHRMELAAQADSLSMALDTATDIRARNGVEKMLAHQAAAAHKLAMQLLTKSGIQLGQVDSWNPASYQAHSVEAARLANAAGRIMGAFAEAMLTLQKLRTGGKQVVTVQHVQVNQGGQAIVAGAVKGGGKRRGATSK